MIKTNSAKIQKWVLKNEIIDLKFCKNPLISITEDQAINEVAAIIDILKNDRFVKLGPEEL